MARSTPTKTKVLATQAEIDAQAAIEAQKAAREANSVFVNAAVRDIIGEYVNAENATIAARGAVATAEEQQRDKLESVYLALGAFSHENGLTVEMATAALDAAMVHFYGDKAKMTVGTVYKTRTYLLRALHPRVAGAVPQIIQPWIDAWNAEQKAVADERAAATAESRDMKPVPTPLKAKFDNRGNAINQAMQLARGADAKLDGKGALKTPAVQSVVFGSPAEVMGWLEKNPRVSRTPKTPVAGATPTATLPADATPRQKAQARVTDIASLLEALRTDYPTAEEQIAVVIAALAHVTGDRMVPATQAPSGAEAAAKAAADKAAAVAARQAEVAAAKAAEPVAGASDLDLDMVLRAEKLGVPYAALVAAMKTSK